MAPQIKHTLLYYIECLYGDKFEVWLPSKVADAWAELGGALKQAKELSESNGNSYRVVDQEGNVYEATSPFVVEGNTSFNDKKPAGPVVTKVRRKRIYLIGSLRNPKVQEVAAKLRADGYEVFDDWQSAGPEADDYWQKYAQTRGWTMAQALAAASAQNVFEFDRRNIEESDIGVLVMPAGKSGHLELGVMIGSGKPGFILLDGEPERFDVMYNYSPYSGGIVATSVEQLLKALDGV